MQKRFGQNFLISPGVRVKLKGLLELDSDDLVWEIGPGLGAMTHMVIDECRELKVFEIDHGFIRFLKESFGPLPGFTIIEGDVLKSWPSALASGPVPDIIFGNLPYNCAATFIGDLIEHGVKPRKMVYTIQREVAERMVSLPGSKQYGAFSILCALSWDVRIAGLVKPGAFYPSPEVTSAILEMVPHGRFSGISMPAAAALIRDLFASRRKTIRNCLANGTIAAKVGREAVLRIASGAGMDPDKRGEEIGVEAVVNAVRYLTDEFGLNIID
jgi:16S rRNA (adenine1518-N6/adenine1519-N6)-dimethyltransferase